MTRCPECADGVFQGNGKCNKCYGRGKIGSIADEVLGEKGNCPRCLGSGECPRCHGTGQVASPSLPPQPRPHAKAELNPFDDKIAVRLSCPNCGDTDWFEWKFLGKLTDPVCGHTWYVETGVYAVQQTRAVFQTARKSVRYMNSAVGPGQGAWVAKIVGTVAGATFGVALRLPYAVLLIPIQAGVRWQHLKKQQSTALPPPPPPLGGPILDQPAKGAVNQSAEADSAEADHSQ